jgi:hypothetical protein
MGGASAVQRRVIGDVELDRIELARQTDTRSLPASKIPDGLAVSRYLAVKEGRELSRHGGHQGTIPSPRANPPSASALTGGSPWNRRITSPRSRHAKPGQPIARRERRGQSRPAARQRVVGFVTERPASWYRAFCARWNGLAARDESGGPLRCEAVRSVAPWRAALRTRWASVSVHLPARANVRRKDFERLATTPDRRRNVWPRFLRNGPFPVRYPMVPNRSARSLPASHAPRPRPFEK